MKEAERRIGHRFSVRAVVTTGLLTLSVLLAYLGTCAVEMAKGRGGRSDIQTLIVAAAVLICLSGMVCTAWLRWSRTEATIAIVPFLFLLWPFYRLGCERR